MEAIQLFKTIGACMAMMIPLTTTNALAASSSSPSSSQRTTSSFNHQLAPTINGGKRNDQVHLNDDPLMQILAKLNERELNIGQPRITMDDFTPTTPDQFATICTEYHSSDAIIDDDRITTVEAANFFEHLCDELPNPTCTNIDFTYNALSVPIQLAFIDIICPKDDNHIECVTNLRETLDNSELVAYQITASKDIDADFESYCSNLYALSTDYHFGTRPPTKSPVSTKHPAFSSPPSTTPKPSSIYSHGPSSSSTPTMAPSISSQPSMRPSSTPTMLPSVSPLPSVRPSPAPSMAPSISSQPSMRPSSTPTMVPSVSPVPSVRPSSTPSMSPSYTPSAAPSISASPTEMFEYKRSITFMIGLDDPNVQYDVIAGLRPDILSSLSDAIINVMTNGSPMIMGNSTASSSTLRRRLEAVLRFADNNEGGVEHTYLREAICTDSFLESTNCIMIASEVTLTSSSYVESADVDNVVYPLLRISMNGDSLSNNIRSLLSFVDEVNIVDVKEVRYLNDGGISQTVSTSVGNSISGGTIAGIVIGSCFVVFLLGVLSVLSRGRRVDPDPDDPISDPDLDCSFSDPENPSEPPSVLCPDFSYGNSSGEDTIADSNDKYTVESDKVEIIDSRDLVGHGGLRSDSNGASEGALIDSDVEFLDEDHEEIVIDFSGSDLAVKEKHILEESDLDIDDPLDHGGGGSGRHSIDGAVVSHYDYLTTLTDVQITQINDIEVHAIVENPSSNIKNDDSEFLLINGDVRVHIFFTREAAEKRSQELNNNNYNKGVIHTLDLGSFLVQNFISNPSKYIIYDLQGNTAPIQDISLYTIILEESSVEKMYCLKACLTEEERDTQFDKMNGDNQSRCAKDETDFDSIMKDMQNEKSRINYETVEFMLTPILDVEEL